MTVPYLGGNEWTYERECLYANWVSSVGNYVNRFERTLAERVGARGAVARASGTATLHIALLVPGVRHGDEVLVPMMTFIAHADQERVINTIVSAQISGASA